MLMVAFHSETVLHTDSVKTSAYEKEVDICIITAKTLPQQKCTDKRQSNLKPTISV